MENHDWDNDFDFLNDWLQTNWDLMVRRELFHKKEIQKYSISINEAKNLDSDFKVCLDSDEEELFLYFATKVENTYGVYPPFDTAVLLNKNNELVYKPINNLQFKSITKRST